MGDIPGMDPAAMERMMAEMKGDSSQVKDKRRRKALEKLKKSGMSVSGVSNMDIDQLEKAVSGKFPNRKYNEAWRRLFIEAPTGQSKYENGPIRLTSLQESVPQQSAIRASYEQEDAVLTFAPNTSQSKLSYSSSSRKTLTFPGGAGANGRSCGAPACALSVCVVGAVDPPVSYTHLTLPTILLV